MSIFARLRQARERRQAARELRALEPYVLRDIGIEPGQIDQAVAGMLSRPDAELAPAARPQPREVAKPAPDALLFKASVFSKVDWPYPHKRAA